MSGSRGNRKGRERVHSHPTHRPDGIGAPLLRSEDRRLLTGQGCYATDRFPVGVCHAALVRSPHAHARIRAIDTASAVALPGVLAVLTGQDAAADGLGPIPHNPEWTGAPGPPAADGSACW